MYLIADCPITPPDLRWDATPLPTQDNTVVSGDSLGRLQIWDGVTGTLLQSLTTHDADILALAVAADGDRLYVSGVDNKVVELRHVSISDAAASQKGDSKKWIVSGKRRDHTHDVRTLALSAGPNPLLVSGGVDCNLMVYSTEGFGQAGASHRKVPPFLHVSGNEHIVLHHTCLNRFLRGGFFFFLQTTRSDPC